MSEKKCTETLNDATSPESHSKIMRNEWISRANGEGWIDRVTTCSQTFGGEPNLCVYCYTILSLSAALFVRRCSEMKRKKSSASFGSHQYRNLFITNCPSAVPLLSAFCVFFHPVFHPLRLVGHRFTSDSKEWMGNTSVRRSAKEG